jgi:hypothetical protein
MEPSLLRDLADLVYQYGPFGFSILFLYSISRWAYKRYDEASKENPPNPDKQKSTRWIYIVSFAAGVALVAVSVGWWFIHHPLYVVRGEIRGLDHNTRISSTELYFLERPHAARSDIDTPVHDEQFIAISEHPFGRTHKFPIDFSKNEATHDQLEIECGPDDGGNIFAPGLKGGKNTLDRIGDASPSFNWMKPQVVYAKQNMPAQQPTYQLKPPPSPKLPQRQETSQVGQQFYSPVVAILVDPHSSVGEKIVQLRKLQSVDPQTMLGYLRLNLGGAPFAATILDLSRHSDPELAYSAKSIVSSSVFQDYLHQDLISRDPGTRQAAQSALSHMDPEWAAQFKTGEVAADVKNRALVPTNFPDGDRYFMEIRWAPNDRKQVDCLADFFASSLDSGGSEAKEKALMRNRSQRLIYSAYSGWVVPAASKIENCGAAVSFVRPSAKEAQ